MTAKDTADRIDQLAESLAQMRVLLEKLSPEQLDDPTPCQSWDVRTLVDHVLSDLDQFLAQARGDEADTDTPDVDLDDGWVEPFAVRADALVDAWRAKGEVEGDPIVQQIAEFALHGWDLAVATRQDVSGMDPDLAEVALAWMTPMLKDEYRGSEEDGKMFGPEVDIEDDAPPYERLAAFAGRTPA